MSHTTVTHHDAGGRSWRLPDGPAGCTPWFAGGVQPVQPGVYQRAHVAHDGMVCILYAYWDDFWFAGRPTPAEAAKEAMASAWQVQPWRGLQQPPAEGYGLAASDSEGGEAC